MNLIICKPIYLRPSPRQIPKQTNHQEIKRSIYKCEIESIDSIVQLIRRDSKYYLMKQCMQNCSQTQQDALYHKIFNMVQNFMSENDNYKATAAEIKDKTKKIFQVLNEDSTEPLYVEEQGENDKRESFFEMNEIDINESQMNRIGVDLEEEIERMMFSDLAQRPIEQPEEDKFQEVVDENQEEFPVKMENEDASIVKLFEEMFSISQRPKGRMLTRSQLKKYPFLKKDQQFEIDGRKTPEIELSSSLSEMCPKSQKKKRTIRKRNKKSENKSIQKRKRQQVRRKYSRLTQIQQMHIKKGRRSANPQMEIKLVNWVNKVLRKGLKVTQRQIRRKARELVQKSKAQSTFTASKGWMEKFLKRNKQLSRKVSERKIRSLDEVSFSDSENSMENEKIDNIDFNFKSAKGKSRQ